MGLPLGHRGPATAEDPLPPTPPNTRPRRTRTRMKAVPIPEARVARPTETLVPPAHPVAFATAEEERQHARAAREEAKRLHARKGEGVGESTGELLADVAAHRRGGGMVPLRRGALAPMPGAPAAGPAETSGDVDED